MSSPWTSRYLFTMSWTEAEQNKYWSINSFSSWGMFSIYWFSLNCQRRTVLIWSLLKPVIGVSNAWAVNYSPAFQEPFSSVSPYNLISYVMSFLSISSGFFFNFYFTATCWSRPSIYFWSKLLLRPYPTAGMPMVDNESMKQLVRFPSDEPPSSFSSSNLRISSSSSGLPII